MVESEFKFQKNDTIGAGAAEDDSVFLHNCFVDTGDLEVLENFEEIKSIVVGRTGAGKSALLERLKHRHPEKIIPILPDNLSLKYISNSTLLKYFENLGVKMEPFFKLLWQHVLSLEVFAKCFPDGKTSKSTAVISDLMAKFSSLAKRGRTARLRYEALLECEDDFWIDADDKIKEIVSKCEKELGAFLAGKLGIEKAKLEATLSGNLKITEEQRKEVVARGQEIISKPLIKVLKGIYPVVDSIVGDQRKSFYIIIDQLDEDWVEESIRYKLIMALVKAVRDCGNLKNLKLIIAMRKDLLERVFKLTAKDGFQPEKYESFYLRLVWDKSSLVDVLDARVNKLVRYRYTKKPLKHTDLLPKKYSKCKITKYIEERAATPRDMIDLFNKCILVGSNKARLTAKEFSLADGAYSQSRLEALFVEWSSDYPDLEDFVKILEGLPPSFKANSINEGKLEDFCLAISTKRDENSTHLSSLAYDVAMGELNCNSFLIAILSVFYKIGIIGLKLSTTVKTSWADELGRSVSTSELEQNVSVKVHKKYHRALGIKTN